MNKLMNEWINELIQLIASLIWATPPDASIWLPPIFAAIWLFVGETIGQSMDQAMNDSVNLTMNIPSPPHPPHPPNLLSIEDGRYQ